MLNSVSGVKARSPCPAEREGDLQLQATLGCIAFLRVMEHNKPGSYTVYTTAERSLNFMVFVWAAKATHIISRYRR